MHTSTLRDAMGRRRLNQKQLAERSGVDQATISRLVRGRISNPLTDTVRRLERALRIRRGSLVFGAPETEVRS